ncbi:MAG: pyridoxal phosphate-dependent decarboxylase family protein [Candidatus Hodarchaeota archaeon]
MIEETLDPEKWEEIRKLGYQIIDDMVGHLKNIRRQPVWQPIPQEVKDVFQSSIPIKGQDIHSIYDEIKDYVISYRLGNAHPHFWGWVFGTGTLFGAFGDFIASAINASAGGFEQSAAYVEDQIIEWAKEMFGYDPQASGLITRGASMANIIGLTIARNVKAGFDIREEGFQSDHAKLTYYGSEEMHSSLQKAVELIGVGNRNLRRISVTENFQINLEELQETIINDKEKGCNPICIIGNLGTVNTGAVDDLNSLADIARQHNMWFHIDGAFGVLTRISPKSHHLADGIERADSIAFDFHKWMYMNYAAGCVLIKSAKDHYQSFSLTPAYLARVTRGVAGTERWRTDYGVEMSDEFKTLKIWMSLKEHGIKKYGRLVEQNIQQAKYLTSLVEQDENLELLAPTSMNIVCFRYKKVGMNREQLNKFNQEILFQLHERGIAVPSYTTLRGDYAIRVAITNHRSRIEDFDIFIKAVNYIAKEIEIKE